MMDPHADKEREAIQEVERLDKSIYEEAMELVREEEERAAIRREIDRNAEEIQRILATLPPAVRESFLAKLTGPTPPEKEKPQ